MTLRPSANPRHGLVLGNPRRRQVVRRIDTWRLYETLMMAGALAMALLAVVTRAGGGR